jgi:hypothetical protein
VPQVARRCVSNKSHHQGESVLLAKGSGAGGEVSLIRVCCKAFPQGVWVEPHQHVRQRSKQDRYSPWGLGSGTKQQAGRPLLGRLQVPLVRNHRWSAPVRNLARVSCKSARNERRYLTPPSSYIRKRSFLTDISEDISFFWRTAVAYAFIALVNTFAGECAPLCFISASFWRITLSGIFAATRA